MIALLLRLYRAWRYRRCCGYRWRLCWQKASYSTEIRDEHADVNYCGWIIPPTDTH